MTSNPRWPVERAQAWYAQKPWLVGCNYIPSTAVNQLEMWQADSFDPVTIDRELGWAAALGMNTVRVFLHDLVWRLDADGFRARIDRFLGLAARHRVATMFVLFDDCWHDDPAPGAQPDPVPGIHNSRWVQSPGSRAVGDRGAWKPLETYVRGIVGAFRSDERVLAWDLYNEPGNRFLTVLSRRGIRRNARLLWLLTTLYVRNRSLPLLRETFGWARAVEPIQPLTAGMWGYSRSLDRYLLHAADVISFHHYRSAPHLGRTLRALRRSRRPLFCTEFLARTAGCRFETHLPVFQDERVACYCWGLVS